jgi:MoaA/NifB/PqqE/SkfB family radical SAM enzyme
MFTWHRLKSLRVELTNVCNLRCRMCGIWAETPKTTFDRRTYEDILMAKVLRKVRLISLTGGEPFALGNLHDYYALARKHHPWSHINISTNGYYTAHTVDFLQRADQRKTSVTISYDGISSHDAIRGVEGSAQQLLETAKQVRDRFPRVTLYLKMTILNDNHVEILDTARECKELGIPFRVKTLETLKCHQSRSGAEVEGPDYSPEVIAAITDQLHRVLKLGINTNKKYIQMLIRQNAGAPVSCNCSPRTLFVGVDGKVFLCRRKDPIGNVFRQPLDEIWRSEARVERLREMREPHGSALSLGFMSD